MVLAYPAGLATVSLLVIGGCEYRMRIAKLVEEANMFVG